MKKLLFLFLSFVVVNSSELEYTLRNKLIYYTQTSDLSGDTKLGSVSKSFERYEYKNYLNVSYENLLLSSTVSLRRNGATYTEDKDTYSIWLGQKRDNIVVEKLYLQYTFAEVGDWKFSTAYGIIPMTGGNIKQFSNQDEVQGNGLFTLIDLNLEGGFVIASNGEQVFKAGKAYWNKNNFQNDEKLVNNNSGTTGNFVIYEHKFGKHLIELNYIDANVRYQEHSMADAMMLGLGYSYNDAVDTGMVYYTILGYSRWKSYFEDVLNAGTFGKKTNSIKYVNTHMPEQYDFDNDVHSGTSLLLGTKYYTDIFGCEADIGLEYFHTSRYYTSFNNGSLFYNDYGYWLRRGSDIYTIYSDLRLYRDLYLSFKYSLVNNRYAPKNGSVAETTDNPNYTFFRTEHNLLFKLTYIF